MNAFNPFKTCELYERHAPRWRLEQDASEFTLEVMESGDWLDRFSEQEHPDDYAYRKRMACPLDMCRDGVRIRVDNLWRTPPRREVRPGPHAGLIERLIHDADGAGTSLDQFMREACWDMYVTGADIVTQCSSARDGAFRTRADQLAADLRPWFMRFNPLLRPDWAADGAGVLLWARYFLGRRPRGDERFEPDADEAHFLTVGRRRWRLWSAEGDPARGGAAEILDEGEHPLGAAPIIKLYYAESRKAGQHSVPLSLLTRPAMVARVALNLKSQADADLLAAVTRWMLAGAGAEELPESFAPGVVWKLPNPDARLQVAQGDVAHIEEKRHWLTLYLTEILRLLKFRGAMAEMGASSSSGLKLALERTDFDNELRATAARLEATELEMMRHAVCLATGERIAPHEAAETLGYSVVYNRDFILEPVAEMLDNIRTWLTGCRPASEQVHQIGREMLRQLTNMLTPASSHGYRTAMEQIDAAFDTAADGERPTRPDSETPQP